MARPANPELRAEIIRAATRIVESCGPDCVTMREVAQEVGYSSTTLYLYFKDKHDILRAVILEGFDQFADFGAMSEVGPGHLDRFRQHARAHVVWALMHPGLYRLMFQSDVPAEWTPEEGARIERGMNDAIAALVAAGDSGLLAPGTDAKSLAGAIWVAVHGVASLASNRRLFAGSELAKGDPQAYLAATTALNDELVNRLLSCTAAA